MNDQHTPAPFGFESDDLDGHTIEELTEYLDRGRVPLDPSIEDSPGCQLALDALERLQSVTVDLVAQDAAEEAPADADWVQKILDGIVLDARAGRRIPLPSAETDDLGITEGAVRGLIRAAERVVPGILIGRCRLEGEIGTAGAPVRIELDASVPYGRPIAQLTQRLRDEILNRLRAHTSLTITAIDITVHDIQHIPSGGEDE